MEACPFGLNDVCIGIDAFDFGRQEAGKTRADGFHAQGAHTVEYFVLQGYLVFVPRGRHG